MNTPKERIEMREKAIQELKKKQGEIVTKVEEKETKVLQQAIFVANDVADKILDNVRPCKLKLPVERAISYSLDGCGRTEACEVDRFIVIELLKESGFEVNLESNDEEEFVMYSVFVG